MIFYELVRGRLLKTLDGWKVFDLDRAESLFNINQFGIQQRPRLVGTATELVHRNPEILAAGDELGSLFQEGLTKLDNPFLGLIHFCRVWGILLFGVVVVIQ